MSNKYEDIFSSVTIHYTVRYNQRLELKIAKSEKLIENF